MSEKPTMAEIARRAGVNASTVSRAFDANAPVHEATRAKILKIAADAGYAINASARNLRRQSSEALGLVIPLRHETGQTISDPFFLQMVAAVCDAAKARGYDVIINLHGERELVSQTRLLSSGKADGLIVVGQAEHHEDLCQLGDQSGDLARRVVVWGGQRGDCNYDLVGSDNALGGFLATRHLLELGCRRVLFLGPIAAPEVELRRKGYRQAHAELGLAVDEALTLNVEFRAEQAFAAVTGAVDAGLAFDGLFAASDVMAMAAIRALAERHISVPEDVRIVGYDNIAQTALTIPSLTTIDQNIHLGGAMLVDHLLRKLAGERVAHAMTPTALVVRESTVPRGQ